MATAAKKKNNPQPLQNIKVVARIRPMTIQEQEQNISNIIKFHTHKEVFVKEKKYKFDRVFKPETGQIELYLNVVTPLIKDVVKGYNCTVFAYGQTGTGKTYTMTGEKCRLQGNWKEDQDAGIIPRVAFHIFDELKTLNVDTIVKVSYIELYNEEIRDLLSKDENILQIYNDHKDSTYIKGMNEVLAQDGEGICKLLQRGIVKRQIAPTLMNHQSSRSHTVFTININTRERTTSGEDIIKSGKINLVDLAGNENIARSGCKDIRATELANINRSLLTLGRVIHALVDNPPKHIPYRDSKLTRILQDSLGGHTKTVIIATVSPASNSYEETTSTLEYATRARDIKNTPTINEKMTKHAVVDGLVKEIDRLQKDLDAARSGTGFYVDKENFQKILDAISAVTGGTVTAEELSNQKALRIQNLEELMYSKKEQFEQTIEQCKKHTEELHSAKTIIKEQDEILEQEKFLSKWFENQSSEKLQEAQRLLSATKTLHNEKEILLAKLENQFHINISNETVTQTAVNNVTNMIVKFENEESKKLKLIQAKTHEQLKSNALDIRRTFLDSSDIIRELTEQYESSVKKEKIGFSSKHMIMNKMNEFYAIIRNKAFEFENILSQYEEQLKILEVEVSKMITNHTQNMATFSGNIMSLIKSADSKLKIDIAEQNVENYEHLDNLEKEMSARIKRDENMIATLQKSIEQEKKNLSRTQIKKQNLKNREKRMEVCISERIIDLDKLVKESDEALEKCSQLPNLIKIQGGQVQDLLIVVKEFEEQLNRITFSLDEKYKEQKITLETTEHFIETFLKTYKVIEENFDISVNNFVEIIDHMMEKTDIIEPFSVFASNIKQIISEQILNKNIKAIHAGDTPVRQTTSYPSRIPDVAPRQSLIEKFKQTYRTKIKEEEERNEYEEDSDS